MTHTSSEITPLGRMLTASLAPAVGKTRRSAEPLRSLRQANPEGCENTTVL